MQVHQKAYFGRPLMLLLLQKRLYSLLYGMMDMEYLFQQNYRLPKEVYQNLLKDFS